MNSPHIYFDEQASADAAKRTLEKLRQTDADPRAQQKLVNQYQIRSTGKNIAQRVLFDEVPDPKMLDSLARSIAMNERLEQDFHEGFEKTLYQGKHALKAAPCPCRFLYGIPWL